MMQKIFLGLAIFALVAFVVTMLLAPVFIYGSEINSQVVRLWVGIFLGYNLILVFAVLRLYNAVVGNTKMLVITVRKLDKFIGELRRIVGDSTATARAFTSATKAIDRLTDKLSERSDKKESNETTLEV